MLRDKLDIKRNHYVSIKKLTEMINEWEKHNTLGDVAKAISVPKNTVVSWRQRLKEEGIQLSRKRNNLSVFKQFAELYNGNRN